MASKKELQICQHNSTRNLVVPVGATLQELKIAVVLYTLEMNYWHGLKSSAVLGMSRTALVNYLESIGVNASKRSFEDGSIAQKVYFGIYSQPKKYRRSITTEKELCPCCMFDRAQETAIKNGWKQPELKEAV